MRSEVRVAPVFRTILYAQAWEDPEVDRMALRIGPGDDVFAIAASGDNALAFLLDEPRSLTALDFNLTQCCLMELKMAAIAALEHGELLELLGVRPCRRRAALYRRIRDALSAKAREYWDAHPEIIERGVIHAGRFENYFRLFRRFVLPLIHGQRIRRDLLACRTLAEQRRLYDRRWNTWRWRLLFRLFFNRTVMGRFGRDPAMFKYVEGDVAATIIRRAEHGITATPARTNWFMEYILTGNYQTAERLPPYLREENQPRLRRLLERVKLVNDEIEAFLPSVPAGSFSKYYLSDIFEYMSEQAAAALFAELVRTSRDGAILSYREMMVPRPPPAALREQLVEDAELGARCHELDRAFFYGAHRVVTVRKQPAGSAAASTRAGAAG
ncbi:MAG: S-adenosylmethionine--diacylglycerol 3-amino-3-carboxypropyl transferase [Planctomycetota bacterium]|nr:MAG: S-adenosylmethionine--diacylglycerol 3-amino-3-carboxypropyl transferase [Planctomycetota bacterium]